MDEIEQAEEIVDESEETEEEETIEDSPAAQEKPKETPEAKLARLDRQASKLRKQLGLEDKPKKDAKPAPTKSKTDGLDETQLDYLDLKGITESEDIEVIQKVIVKTGMTVREALKDDYVVSKLKDLKEQRDVKGAIPSSTKRGAATASTVEQALARFERDGKLPDDFELRSKVVNALTDKNGSSKPAWG